MLRNTFRPTHLLNWTRICRSLERGCEIHDMGRITGDAYDENNPLYGLCRYKQSYAGTVTEYCGDLYLINNGLGFFLFTKGLPFAKKVKNTLLKKIIKKSFKWEKGVCLPYVNSPRKEKRNEKNYYRM